MTTLIDAEISYDDLTDSQLDHFYRSSTIAWDIETSGLDWRKDEIGTCQLSDGEGFVVLVKLGTSIPGKLRQLLANPSVRKIFHHAPFDLRFMSHQWSVIPSNIACTKVAAKILWPAKESSQYSLKPLLAQVLGIKISKALQTSDWLSQELTREQIAYASEDVRHLHSLLAYLEAEANRLGVGRELYNSFQYIPTRVALEIRGSGDVFAY